MTDSVELEFLVQMCLQNNNSSNLSGGEGSLIIMTLTSRLTYNFIFPPVMKRG